VCSEANLLSYGDLELFLAGIGLSALVPLFKQHHISFSEFLRLTDSDLQTVCSPLLLLHLCFLFLTFVARRIGLYMEAHSSSTADVLLFSDPVHFDPLFWEV